MLAPDRGKALRRFAVGVVLRPVKRDVIRKPFIRKC